MYPEIRCTLSDKCLIKSVKMFQKKHCVCCFIYSFWLRIFPLFKAEIEKMNRSLLKRKKILQGVKLKLTFDTCSYYWYFDIRKSSSTYKSIFQFFGSKTGHQHFNVEGFNHQLPILAKLQEFCLVNGLPPNVYNLAKPR